MRSWMLVMAGLAIVAGVAAFASLQAADESRSEPDPFVGRFIKYGRWESRPGQFHEASEIVITKEGDTYQLSKPYEHWKFKQTEKGVISDGKGGIGSIYFGEAKFIDGHRVRVLRAEFCYEQFILYDMAEKPGAAKAKK